MKNLKIDDIILFEPDTGFVCRGTVISINTVDDIPVAEIQYDLQGSIQGIAFCKRPLSNIVLAIDAMCVTPTTDIF